MVILPRVTRNVSVLGSFLVCSLRSGYYLTLYSRRAPARASVRLLCYTVHEDGRQERTSQFLFPSASSCFGFPAPFLSCFLLFLKYLSFSSFL